MLTTHEWDKIAGELEKQVMPNYGNKENKYLWALYGGLLQHMKNIDMSIDEALEVCEEQVFGEKKWVSKKS